MTGRVPAFLIAISFLTWLPATAWGQEEIATDDAPEFSDQTVEVLSVLRETRTRPEWTVVDVRRKLIPNMEAALGEMVGFLVEGRLPCPHGSGSPQTISRPQKDFLLAALRELPANQVRRAAIQAEGVESGPRAAEAALFLWRACATSGDIPHMARLAAPDPSSTDGEPADPKADEGCVSEFEAAVTRLIQEDSQALDEVSDLIRACDKTLRPALVRSIGSGGRPEGLRLLLDIANGRGELGTLAIAQVGRLGASPDLAVNRDWAEFLSGVLRGEDGPNIRLALIAAGTIEAYSAMDEILAMAREGSGRSRDAFWALRKMTGLTLPDDADRWETWLEGEREWFKREFPGILQDLRTGNQAVALRAARTISAHRYCRDLIVMELEAAVDVVDHRTRPAICSALGNLGSMRAIPILLELLEFGTPGTSAAAQAALVRLTGRRDVAADSRLWIEELGLDDAR